MTMVDGERMPTTARHRAWHVRARRAMNVLVPVAAVASAPLTFLQLQGDTSPVVAVVDWVVWVIFVADVVVSLRESKHRPFTVWRHWAGVALVVLTFPLTPAALHGAGLVRVARFTRLARAMALTARGSRALSATLGRKGFVYVAAITVMVTAVAAGAIAVAEPEVVHGDYWYAVWWAVVTAFTVGYGDVSPATLSGRVIATLLMLTGIGLASTLAASVTAYFVRDDEAEQLADMRAHLVRIEEHLEAMRRNHARDGLTSAEGAFDDR